jgi:hypothetical protein
MILNNKNKNRLLISHLPSKLISDLDRNPQLQHSLNHLKAQELNFKIIYLLFLKLRKD